MTNPTREQLLVAMLKARNDGFRTYAEALAQLYQKLYGRPVSCLTGKGAPHTLQRNPKP